MPAQPKAPAQRRRRNVGQSQWRQLPATGPEVKAPALPRRDGGWLTSTRAWWKRVWASPMAAAWLESDYDVVLRLAVMQDAIARRPEQPALQAQITALEDRLGLTPKARRALQWEVTQAERGAQPGPPATVRRLRAVG